MELFQTMALSASGLRAQRTVMKTIAGNLANAQTTRTPQGGPYRRRQVILSTSPLASPFENALSAAMRAEPLGVKAQVIQDRERVKIIYDPTHPDADENGSVALPDVEIMEEMIQLLQATRNYEANITVFNSAKHMALKSLEIGAR